MLLKDRLSFTSDAVPHCFAPRVCFLTIQSLSGLQDIFLRCKTFFSSCFEQITSIKFVSRISEYCLKSGWWSLDSFKFVSGVLQPAYNYWARRNLLSLLIPLCLLMFKHCVWNAINKETAWLVQSNIQVWSSISIGILTLSVYLLPLFHTARQKQSLKLAFYFYVATKLWFFIARVHHCHFWCVY